MGTSYWRYEILLPRQFNDNRRFFIDLKGRLKARFQQIEIWLTSSPIDLL
jgi:hypothetical protein